MWANIFSGLTALGTVGACIISLILAFRKESQRLDCVFIWGVPNDYKPTLLINNLCNRTVVISKINIYYGGKPVATFDCFDAYNMKEYAIIPATTEKSVPLDADQFSFDDMENADESEKLKKKPLKIVVQTASGKNFVSKQAYSYDDVMGLLFGYEFLKSD